MPIFEYACRGCGREFEAFVQRSEAARCPTCRGEDLERKLSVFAVGTAEPSPARGEGGCGSCGDPRGPGACARN